MATSARDIVVVVGTTGVGKSQLAVSLARAQEELSRTRYGGGEVVNADSMQVYEGLDIITNKMTPEERLDVRHHLLGFVPPKDEYRVGQFKNDAERVVRSCLYCAHHLFADDLPTRSQTFIREKSCRSL
jgi:tRNA A37 N6-isopentenylltransferase MiaA